jgi:low affinity Fe/Cu permease
LDPQRAEEPFRRLNYNMSNSKSSLFTKFSKKTSMAAGHPLTFIGAVAVIVAWAFLGPVFGFGDTWQLVINTGTTIITFLMVFLIQNTQNRDSSAVQLKLDELIFAIKEADNTFLDVEELDEKELEGRREKMIDLAEVAKNTVL